MRIYLITHAHTEQLPNVAAVNWRLSARGMGQAEMLARALNGLLDLQRRFANETLALVGSGLYLSILRSELLGHVHFDFAAWQKLTFASVACIELMPRELVFDFELSEQNVRT